MDLAYIDSTRLLESDAHLGAYLSSLSNVDTRTLESFNRLADQILQVNDFSSSCDHLQPSSPTNSTSSTGNQWLSSGSSSYFSSASGCVSPIDLPCSPQPSCYSSAGSSSSSSSLSNYSPKQLKRSSAPIRKGKLGGGGGCGGIRSTSGDCHCDNSTAHPSNTRRRREKNATAAERYRRKLKGKRCNLEVEEEVERELNEKLKRQVESKLELYREFIILLAQNTQLGDLDLASLGLNSVLEVISDVCRPSSAWLEPTRRLEFELQAEVFNNILARHSNQPSPHLSSSYSLPFCQGASSPSGLVQHPQVATTATTTSDATATSSISNNHLEFDFYSDSFVASSS